MAPRKVGGKHTTVVGGRRGAEILLKIASHPRVKRVVPGRIEAKGAKVGRGVRFRVTRVDERGNIKAILSRGSSSQEVFIVTAASSPSEGEQIARELEELVAEFAS